MPRESSEIIVRKDWPILMLVEKSDETRAMLSINDMVKRFVQEIVNIQDIAQNCSIKIGTYTFSNSSHFIHPNKLVSILEYEISEVFKNDVVDLTGIINQLNNDLSRKTLLNGESGYYLPMLIFILDGNKKYIAKDAVEQINQNKWFRRAPKIAFLVNDHISREDDLLKILGNKEVIFNVTNTEEALDILRKLLSCINVPSTGSICANRSNNTDDTIVFVDPIDDDPNDDGWTGDDSWD